MNQEDNMLKDKPLLCYFGHHKCASTWIEAICGSVCHDLSIKYKIAYTAKDFDFDLQNYVDSNGIDFIAYANADYKFIEPLRNYLGFHVVRDPRDVVVSAYFSHKNSHPTHAWPELISYRKKLQNCTKDEGLHLEIDFRSEQFQEMMSWPEHLPNVLEYKMEDLTQHDYRLFIEIFRFLHLLDQENYTATKRAQYFLAKSLKRIEHQIGVSFPSPMKRLPVERLLGIVWENSFSRQTKGRKAGQEDPNSHFRKGEAGDWINHLNDEHITEINARFKPVIKKYRYGK